MAPHASRANGSRGRASMSGHCAGVGLVMRVCLSVSCAPVSVPAPSLFPQSGLAENVAFLACSHLPGKSCAK